MKPLLTAAVLGLGLAASGTATAEIYKFDPGHTEIRFHYNHAGMSE